MPQPPKHTNAEVENIPADAIILLTAIQAIGDVLYPAIGYGFKSFDVVGACDEGVIRMSIGLSEDGKIDIKPVIEWTDTKVLPTITVPHEYSNDALRIIANELITTIIKQLQGGGIKNCATFPEIVAPQPLRACAQVPTCKAAPPVVSQESQASGD